MPECNTVQFFVVGFEIVHHFEDMQNVRLSALVKLSVMCVGCDVQHVAEHFAFLHCVSPCVYLVYTIAWFKVSCKSFIRNCFLQNHLRCVRSCPSRLCYHQAL